MKTTLPGASRPLSAASDLWHDRAMRLLELDVDFIPNEHFGRPDPESEELAEATLAAAAEQASCPADMPGHLRRLCDAKLLTHAEERALFRQMNDAKFRACELRASIDLQHVDRDVVVEAERLLGEAERIRDHLIQANTRLVMSIVKKFVTPQQSFDDLLSEGIFVLMQAVEKFDFDRGFRFSTYAYRSIARHAYRTVSLAQLEESRRTRDAEEWAFEQQEDRSVGAMSDQVWGNLRELTASMLMRLDRRERFIIRSRYALGSHRKVRTFQFLADKLGVSKERARQLEKRAVSKLQQMASEVDLDDVMGAAMV